MESLVRADLSQLTLLLPCEIDLSGVESIDDRAVEMLLGLKSEGLVERFVHHSRVVLEALSRQNEEHEHGVI